MGNRPAAVRCADRLGARRCHRAGANGRRLDHRRSARPGSLVRGFAASLPAPVGSAALRIQFFPSHGFPIRSWRIQSGPIRYCPFPCSKTDRQRRRRCPTSTPALPLKTFREFPITPVATAAASRPPDSCTQVRAASRVCETCGCDVQGRPGFGPGLAMRFGWWGVENDGSPVKVGEYQGLSSSPFWDLDGVWTDRQANVGFHLVGTG